MKDRLKNFWNGLEPSTRATLRVLKAVGFVVVPVIMVIMGFVLDTVFLVLTPVLIGLGILGYITILIVKNEYEYLKRQEEFKDRYK